MRRSRSDTVRDQLLTAASHLFARRGFDATSLQEIADAVGIRKPSLLYHFPSKDALRLGVLERMLEHWNGVLPRVLLAATSSQGQFDGVLEAMVDFFTEDPDRARILVREALDRPDEMRALVDRYVRPWADATCKYIRKGQKRGHLWTEVDPEAYVVQVIQLMLFGIAAQDSVGTLAGGGHIEELLRVAKTSLFRPDPRSEP